MCGRFVGGAARGTSAGGLALGARGYGHLRPTNPPSAGAGRESTRRGERVACSNTPSRGKDNVKLKSSLPFGSAETAAAPETGLGACFPLSSFFLFLGSSRSQRSRRSLFLAAADRRAARRERRRAGTGAAGGGTRSARRRDRCSQSNPAVPLSLPAWAFVRSPKRCAAVVGGKNEIACFGEKGKEGEGI